MDSPRFADYYRWLLKSILYWGMPSPWVPELSKPCWFLLVIYDFFTLVVIFAAALIYLFSMCNEKLRFQDVILLLPGFVIFGSATYLSLYQYLIKDRLKTFAAIVDAISQKIVDSKLGQKEDFLQDYIKNSEYITYYCRLITYLFTVSSIIFFCSVPAVDWSEGKYRTNYVLAINTPFHDRDPGIYELFIFILTTALFMSTNKVLHNALFFLAFFNILRSCMKFLHMSLEGLQGNDYKNTSENMRVLVKLHQDINRSLLILIQLFSPTVVVISVYIMFYLVIALFLQMDEQENNVYQTLSAFLSVAATVIQIYIIFNISGNVTFEAEDLANAVFGLPWYEMDKKIKYEVQMVIAMCSRPIPVTGYRTKAFIFNRETLAGILTSAMSAYLTLCQMRDALGNKKSE